MEGLVSGIGGGEGKRGDIGGAANESANDGNYSVNHPFWR